MDIDEKISVFISSKCGGENTNYDIVRRSLKLLLEKTGFIKTYVFESYVASTETASQEYCDKLDDSDVCLFLIDNYSDQISEGFLREIKRAQKTGKLSLYLFLNDPNKEKTQIQKELIGPNSARYKEIVDIRDFIENGYLSVINDIMTIYRNYSKGRLVRLSEQSKTADVSASLVATREYDLDENCFSNIDLTKNRFENLIIDFNHEKDISHSSELDRQAVSLLNSMFGETNIWSYDVPSLLTVLESMQTPDLFKFVSKRWESIGMYWAGNLGFALDALTSLYEENKTNTCIPQWLLNDVLIDIRNLKSIDNFEKSSMDFSIDEKISNLNSIIYFPIIDRFSSNLYDEIMHEYLKSTSKSPYTTSLGNNVRQVSAYLANYLVTAMYFGSYTHLTQLLRKLIDTVWNYAIQYENIKIKILLLKLIVLCNDESKYNDLFPKYKYVLSNATYNEIKELYNSSNSKPLVFLRNYWKLLLIKEIGYYFSDNDFVEVSKEIWNIIDIWIDSNNRIFNYGNLIPKIFKSNSMRISADVAYSFAIRIMRNKIYAFLDDWFDALKYYDFSKLTSKNSSLFLKELELLLTDENKRDKFYKLGHLLISIRKSTEDKKVQIDELVQKYMSASFLDIYNLEIHCDSEQESYKYIDNYIVEIMSRNQTQGQNGSYSGYADDPFKVIENIIKVNNLILNQDILKRLLDVCRETLFLSKQTVEEKVSAIELIILLKSKSDALLYNWDDYFGILDTEKEKVLNAKEFTFMSTSTKFTLQFYYLVLKIAFSKSASVEFLKTVSQFSNFETIEKIHSMEALLLLLKNYPINVVPVDIQIMILQYTISNCYDNDFYLRYNSVDIFLSLCESEHSDIVLGFLSIMMDDEDYRIKLHILKNIETININPQISNFILSKGRIDNNYLIRKQTKISEKQLTYQDTSGIIND